MRRFVFVYDAFMALQMLHALLYTIFWGIASKYLQYIVFFVLYLPFLFLHFAFCNLHLLLPWQITRN